MIRSCKIIDFAVPGDSSIEEKEKDKIEKYQDLGRELQKIWKVKVKIIPLVVGSLDAIPKQFSNRLKQIDITVGTAQVQKTVSLGTANNNNNNNNNNDITVIITLLIII